MNEKIPNIPMRKQESPEHTYEQGRLYGIFEIIKRAQKYDGLIETIDDLFKHMDRLQKCCICKRDFYDKRCPDCIEKLNKNLEQKEIIKLIRLPKMVFISKESSRQDLLDIIESQLDFLDELNELISQKNGDNKND